MNELDKLKQLLDELLIDYTVEQKHEATVIRLVTKPAQIVWWGEDTFTILGCGYQNQFEYSAECVARMLDRKFREEMKVQR